MLLGISGFVATMVGGTAAILVYDRVRVGVDLRSACIGPAGAASNVEAFQGMTESGPYSLSFTARKQGLPDKWFSIKFGTADAVLEAMGEMNEWNWDVLEIRQDSTLITEEHLHHEAGLGPADLRGRTGVHQDRGESEGMRTI